MHLRISTEIPLHEPDSDAGFVTWLHVDILEDNEESAGEKRVGHARAAIVHVGRALDSEESLLDVLDADSGALEALYEVYFDPKTDWFKEELAEAAGRDLLYIHEIEIEPGHAGRNVELALVRRLADTLGQGCELVVLPFGSRRDVELWSRLGFSVSTPGAGEGYMHLSLAFRGPRIDEDKPGHFKIVPNPSPDTAKIHH